ncbi:MAG: ABC transporter permease [Caulobacteraceae bacterium]
MMVARASRPSPARVLGASLRRETTYLARSPWDLTLLFALPLCAIVLIAAMFIRGTLQHIPITLVNEDGGALSRSIVRRLEASHALKLASQPSSLPAAFSEVRRARAYLVVLIPHRLEAEALHRRSPAIVLYEDASFQTVGSQAASAAQQAIVAALADQAARFTLAGGRLLPFEPPKTQVTILGNPQQSFELFLEALILPGVLHLLTSCACVAAVGRELSNATLSAWMQDSGGRLGCALIGKLAPYVAVFSAWGAVWVVWLAGYRGWPVEGSLPAILVGQSLLYAATASVAALLVAVARDPDTALSISTVYAGSAIAYSNGTLPTAHASWFARAWSSFLPFSSYPRLQQEQWVLGSSLLRSAPSAGVLLLFIVIPFAIAAPLLKRLARRPPKLEGLPVAGLGHGGFGASFVSVFVTAGRSRPLLSLLVLSVVLYGFYYPLAYALQSATQLPTAVVDLDGTPLSRRFVRGLAATRAIDVAARPASAAEGEQQLRQNRVDAVVLIPDGLEAGVLKRAPGGVGLYLTGAYLVRAREIGGAIAATLSDEVETALEPILSALKALGAPPIQIAERPLFNLANGYGSYAVSGVASIILQQTLLFGCATFAAWRREKAPDWRMRPAGFLGTWTAFTSLGCLTSLFYFGFIFWFQDFPRGGDPAGLVIGVVLFAAATSALGLLIGSAFREHSRVVQILAGTSVPLFFLAGLAWPPFAMPTWVALLAKLAPSTSAVPGFIKLWGDGATLGEAAPELGTLACLAIVYAGLGFVRFTGAGAVDRPL